MSNENKYFNKIKGSLENKELVSYGGLRSGGKTCTTFTHLLKNIDPELAKAFFDSFRVSYFGPAKCDTIDNEGNHCPEPVTHEISIPDKEAMLVEEIKLCDKCFKNYNQNKNISNE